MTKCNRCDWQPAEPEAVFGTDRTQLTEHAIQADHPLCLVDEHRSLHREERRVCERCITRCRQHLADIVEGYALLPEQLGHPAPVILDRDGGRTDDGHALPGGNALVMLAAGSEGAFGDDFITSRPDDPDSIPNFLATVEDDWRHIRSEPAAVVAGGRGGATATVVAAAGYLERRMRWAADHHPEFADFAQRLRDLRDAVQAANQMLDRPAVAKARCHCGGKLTRDYRPEHRCAHGPYPTELEDQDLPMPGAMRGGEPVPGPHRRPLDVLRRILAQRQAAWQRDHGKCDQGGQEKNWVCRDCGREYDDAEYWVAMRGHLEAS